MLTYYAYNLCIHSDIHFPELIPVETHKNQIKNYPKVTLSIRSISPSELQEIDGYHRFCGRLNNLTMDKFLGRFLVKYGRNIVIEPAPGIDEAILRAAILGPVISVLLRQRGLLVLHGSSIAIGGQVVAFLGHSGWGKSTLAHAFYNQGYSFLTDDVMAINVAENHPMSFPGFPQVRLLPDSATSLGHQFETLPLINSLTIKRSSRVSQKFPQTPLPLQRIYILAAGHHNEVEHLSPQEAFLALVQHSWCTDLLTHQDWRKHHFQHCSTLLNKTPIYRLQRKWSLAALPELIKFIEADIADNSSTSQSEPRHLSNNQTVDFSYVA